MSDFDLHAGGRGAANEWALALNQHLSAGTWDECLPAGATCELSDLYQAPEW